ncbi:MAG: hypothetical protein BWY83_01467 [bacterium ADurb.Bin478]|nr:MAG: hypothetical protein BWY83_01467 [bacterium ADurb.Bin478]
MHGAGESTTGIIGTTPKRTERPLCQSEAFTAERAVRFVLLHGAGADQSLRRLTARVAQPYTQLIMIQIPFCLQTRQGDTKIRCRDRRRRDAASVEVDGADHIVRPLGSPLRLNLHQGQFVPRMKQRMVLAEKGGGTAQLLQRQRLKKTPLKEFLPLPVQQIAAADACNDIQIHALNLRTGHL